MAEADAADVEKAVKAARAAFERGPWRKMPASERGRLLNRLADLIEANADELAALESLDNGKPMRWPRRWTFPPRLAATVLRGLGRQDSRQDDPDRRRRFSATRGMSQSAWSGRLFPGIFRMLMQAWKLAPGTGDGKHGSNEAGRADASDRAAHRRVDCGSGIPGRRREYRCPGYGPTAGAAIANHMDVDKVAFTGSTEVGH